MELSNLTGTNSFVLIGQAGDFSGTFIVGMGDVNGDQIADLMIGAYAANANLGKSYIVFGRLGLGNNGSLAFSSLNGTNGFVLNGQAFDYSGYSAASAGDVDGDKIADVLIGAYRANSNAGNSYVVFGRKLSNPLIFLPSHLLAQSLQRCRRLSECQRSRRLKSRKLIQ